MSTSCTQKAPFSSCIWCSASCTSHLLATTSFPCFLFLPALCSCFYFCPTSLKQHCLCRALPGGFTKHIHGTWTGTVEMGVVCDGWGMVAWRPLFWTDYIYPLLHAAVVCPTIPCDHASLLPALALFSILSTCAVFLGDMQPHVSQRQAA